MGHIYIRHPHAQPLGAEFLTSHNNIAVHSGMYRLRVQGQNLSTKSTIKREGLYNVLMLYQWTHFSKFWLDLLECIDIKKLR